MSSSDKTTSNNDHVREEQNLSLIIAILLIFLILRIIIYVKAIKSLILLNRKKNLFLYNLILISLILNFVVTIIDYLHVINLFFTVIGLITFIILFYLVFFNKTLKKLK